MTVPLSTPSGDNTVTVSYEGVTVQPVALITVQGSSPPPTSVSLYVAPAGNDFWSGRLPTPNSTNTDGPFATFDRARVLVQSINKLGLTQVNVQFRAGTYFLPATEMFTSADSGSATTKIVYQNYPSESPIFSGGVRVQNWTNAGGNTWKTTLPASTRYFENLFYNGVRRLRPRLGGSLGTYFRFVGPVYAAAQNSSCSVFFVGSGWECYDRFKYNPMDPIVNTWKNLAPPVGNPCEQPAGNAALAGDIELVNFEQYSVSKLRINCVDTTNQIVYLTGNTATELDHPTSHGFIPNHRYLVENVQDQLCPARAMVPGSLDDFVDADVFGQSRRKSKHRYGYHSSTYSSLGGLESRIRDVSGIDVFEHDNYAMPAGGYDGDSEIIASVSFQNSQHITFDSSTVGQTSGTGLEFISCIDKTSPNWCVSSRADGGTSNNLIENSALYDVAAGAIRIGASGSPSDTNANVARRPMPGRTPGRG